MRTSPFLFFIFLLFISCTEKGVEFENAVCIQNVSTIDAQSGQQDNMTLVIQNGKITKLDKSQNIKLAENNTIIDGTGKFLIPGLWDAHVHFAYIEELAPVMFDLFLAHGVTSVRDTGGKIGFIKNWKDKAEANPTTAPRVMIAGPLMDGMPNVYDGSDPGHPPLSVGLSTPSDAVKYVDYLDSIGVDLLKSYEMLSPEQFKAICKRAKEKGLKVTGHVPLSMDVISASNAGLNSMEHLRNLEMSTAKNADELLVMRKKMLAQGKSGIGHALRSNIHRAQRSDAVEDQDEAQTQKVLKTLAKNKTWQIPTLSIMTGSVERPYADTKWMESFNYLPKEVGDRWREGAANALAKDIDQTNEKYTAWMYDMVGKIHKANIDIMAGTDCPIFYLTPGLSIHHELKLLVRSGLSPAEVLATATLKPAEYFGLEKELGLIAVGMWADLLLLEANPLMDINNSLKINTVIKQGKVYNRVALDEMLDKLKTN